MITLLIAAIVIEIVLLVALTENDWGAAATVSLLGFLALLQLYFQIDLVGFASRFPIHLICGVILYFVLGVGWSIFKWYWYVTKAVDSIKENCASYATSVDIAKKLQSEVPQPKREKARILRWMGYWPVSILWFLLDDIVREVFNWLYHRFAGIYQKITDAAIKGGSI